MLRTPSAYQPLIPVEVVLDVGLQVEVSQLVTLTKLQDRQKLAIGHNGALVSGILKRVLLDVLVNHTSDLSTSHLRTAGNTEE